jgi:hypothetical protein
MQHSRLCAVLIDCKTSDVDQAARFWRETLGRAVDPNHPNSRGNYRMLGGAGRRVYRRDPAGGPRESRSHRHRDRRYPRRSGPPEEGGRQGGESPAALEAMEADRSTFLRRRFS